MKDYRNHGTGNLFSYVLDRGALALSSVLTQERGVDTLNGLAVCSLSVREWKQLFEGKKKKSHLNHPPSQIRAEIAEEFPLHPLMQAF